MHSVHCTPAEEKEKNLDDFGICIIVGLDNFLNYPLRSFLFFLILISSFECLFGGIVKFILSCYLARVGCFFSIYEKDSSSLLFLGINLSARCSVSLC